MSTSSKDGQWSTGHADKFAQAWRRDGGEPGDASRLIEEPARMKVAVGMARGNYNLVLCEQPATPRRVHLTKFQSIVADLIYLGQAGYFATEACKEVLDLNFKHPVVHGVRKVYILPVGLLTGWRGLVSIDQIIEAADKIRMRPCDVKTALSLEATYQGWERLVYIPLIDPPQKDGASYLITWKDVRAAVPHETHRGTIDVIPMERPYDPTDLVMFEAA